MESQDRDHDRALFEDEVLVLQGIANMLQHAMLEPFKPLARPRTTESRLHPVIQPESGVGTTNSFDRIRSKIALFIDEVPKLVSFPAPAVVLPEPITLSLAMAWRTEGRPYASASALAALITVGENVSDLVRLHYNDSMWELGLHGRDFSKLPLIMYPAKNNDKVKAGLYLLAAAETLLEAQLSNVDDILEAALAPSVTSFMYNGTPDSLSAAELYASIVYCHITVALYRLLCTEGSNLHVQVYQSRIQAVQRLLELWTEIKDNESREQSRFLRWRCSTALQECLPFSHATMDLPGRKYAMFRYANSDSHGSAGEGENLTAFEALRAVHSTGQIDQGLSDSLERHLDSLLARIDIRGIDELLIALQLPVHPHFRDLQKALRPLAWQLHQHLLPSAPWVLDGWLLHPLSLWIAEEYRCGRHEAASWWPGPSRSDVVHDITQDTDSPTQVSRLQIGFGKLGLTAEPTASDAARFVYAWSILVSCMQWTELTQDDPVYRLLFVDQDLFSFSQLCHRVRQACRAYLTEREYRDITANGFDERARHVAGLGTIDLDGDELHKLDSLSKEIEALDRLRDEIVILLTSSPSDGLRHLAGACLVFQGCAYIQRATIMTGQLDSLDAATAPPPSNIESELSLAGRVFRKAYEEYQELKNGEVIRRSGEGLIRAQERLAILSRRIHGPDATRERQEAETMIKLCRELSLPLRVRMIQAYGTPAFHFLWQGRDSGHSLSTGPEDIPSRLYYAGTDALYCLGQGFAGFNWLSGDSEDLTQGQLMAMSLARYHNFQWKLVKADKHGV